MRKDFEGKPKKETWIKRRENEEWAVTASVCVLCLFYLFLFFFLLKLGWVCIAYVESANICLPQPMAENTNTHRGDDWEKSLRHEPRRDIIEILSKKCQCFSTLMRAAFKHAHTHARCSSLHYIQITHDKQKCWWWLMRQLHLSKRQRRASHGLSAMKQTSSSEIQEQYNFN